MKRREFIALAGATAGAILLSKTTYGQQKILSSSPKRYISSNGLLDVSLTAEQSRIFLAGQEVNLLSYNGQVPGPILEAQAGDTVRLQFTNNLSQPTNLHYHGLHIPPTGNADNVFLEIPSGESFNYEFTIPKNHRAGLFWYHPHLHGLVANQLFGGLAGLFIVRGELDNIPEVKAATEKILVLQDFDLGSGMSPSMMFGREGQLVTVNGEVKPSLSISQGGLLRLRLLNASISRFYRLKLEDHPFYLIATDGGAISEPVELKELLLTPGERVDVLVKGDRPSGNYRLLNLPYNRLGMGMMGGGMMRSETGVNSSQVLATLNYGEWYRVSALPLPKKLLPVPELPKPEKVRQLTLNHGMAPGMGMVFLINGQPFEHHRIDQQVKLNTVEDWEIMNTGVMDHPFHLHVNDFQIISRNDRPESYRAWKDTVLVARGEKVRIRIPFQDFTGKSVYHCHILDHEDLGMMGMFQIEA